MGVLRTGLWLVVAFLSGWFAWSIPAYFRTVDSSVIQLAALEASSIEETAEAFALEGNSAAANFLRNEPQENRAAIQSGRHPFWSELAADSTPAASASESLLSRLQRQRAIEILDQSEIPGVNRLRAAIAQEPSRNDSPEHKVVVLPQRIGGLLIGFLGADRYLSPSFLSELLPWTESDPPRVWQAFTSQAAVWGAEAPYGALAPFIQSFSSPSEFRTLARLASSSEAPPRSLLLRLVLIGADPEDLIQYVEKYPVSAREDLETAFAAGPGAVFRLLETDRPIHVESTLPPSMPIPGFSWSTQLALAYPAFAIGARTVLFVLAFFSLIAAVSPWLPNPGDRLLEKPRTLQAFFRRLILSSILAASLFFLFEPGLLLQPEEATSFPNSTLSLASLTQPQPQTDMLNSISIDSVTLLILAIFLVLQLGLYVFCLVKLSEIRRQRIPDETKIRLLENEENLFDSGLYLGLGGTVASLILLAVGIVEASLMAAYASTLFGILFVSFFKIFHLRPLKRKLILASNTVR